MLVYILYRHNSWKLNVEAVFTDKQLAMHEAHQLNTQADIFSKWHILERELITNDFMKQILQSKDNT